jgi:CHAT domain-containing protein
LARHGFYSDALSGLARAFFYASTRALLLSLWQQDPDSAVRLTTLTFDALKKDPTSGRVEALPLDQQFAPRQQARPAF